jgi:predicted GIY-YIG superfamily endonuclease
MSFQVYILRCVDDAFYTGHTEDLVRRLGEHAEGTIAGFTSSRRPVELVFSQEFPTRAEALAAERRIKGWARDKKQALITGNWELLSRLASVRGSRASPRAGLPSSASIPSSASTPS